jgi:hypothetical protein
MQFQTQNFESPFYEFKHLRDAKKAFKRDSFINQKNLPISPIAMPSIERLNSIEEKSFPFDQQTHSDKISIPRSLKARRPSSPKNFDGKMESDFIKTTKERKFINCLIKIFQE